jgi:uncharacterized LabA/DUF88 family protein
MSLRDSIRVVQSGQRRIKIFIDFWNVVINARSQTKFNVNVHWDKLAEHLVSHTRQGYFDETTGELAGCYIFGSKSQSNAEQSAFVNKVLDHNGSQAGLFFNFAERVAKQTTAKCSKCDEPVRVSSESGVDVLLTVEMIKHAMMREHEYLALVSSDRDFIPLLTFLKDQGQRVLHVSAGKAEREMRAMTWAQIELLENYPSICSIEHDDYIILTAPGFSKAIEQLVNAAPVPRDQLKIIDVTDRDQIQDRDLAFLMASAGVHWQVNRQGYADFSYSSLKANSSQFRREVANGTIRGNLPCVINNGRVELIFNENNQGSQWIPVIGPHNRPNSDWSKLFEKVQPNWAGDSLS